VTVAQAFDEVTTVLGPCLVEVMVGVTYCRSVMIDATLSCLTYDVGEGGVVFSIRDYGVGGLADVLLPSKSA
jgi:hypothetical protein